MARVPSVRKPDWQAAGVIHGIEVELDVGVHHGRFRHRMSPVSDWANGAPDSEAIAIAQAMGNGLTPEAYLPKRWR